MDRAEATGFGVAVAGHLAVLGALAVGLATVKPPQIRNNPIEVSFVDEVSLESTAPVPSAEMPAPKLAEVEGPPEPLPAPVPQLLPAPPQIQPQPQPQPRAAAPQPAPKPTLKQRPQPPQPAAKAAPAPPPKAAATRPTGRLSGLLTGLADRPTQSKATTPPAAKAGPQVQASLGAEVRRQLKPHWRAPTGADAELLRTQLTVTLSRSGAVVSIDDISTSGQTASNRSQVKLHQEQAVRAVRLAAPFRLPPEYYDSWKAIRPTFDRRLSQ
jgi:outer membrane biosynthesis protein TonB